MKTIVAVIVGAVLGFLGSRVVFVGSALSLIPWTVVGLVLGLWCGVRQSLWVGAAFGFSLAFFFMATGYTGSAPLLTRVPFFALIGLAGAVCGTAVVLLGSLVAARLRRHGASRAA